MLMITLYAKQKKRHRCIEQTFGLCGEGEGGMFQENSIKTCILSRVKQITSPGWMHETSAWTWCTGNLLRNFLSCAKYLQTLILHSIILISSDKTGTRECN